MSNPISVLNDKYEPEHQMRQQGKKVFPLRIKKASAQEL